MDWKVNATVVTSDPLHLCAVCCNRRVGNVSRRLPLTDEIEPKAMAANRLSQVTSFLSAGYCQQCRLDNTCLHHKKVPRVVRAFAGKSSSPFCFWSTHHGLEGDHGTGIAWRIRCDDYARICLGIGNEGGRCEECALLAATSVWTRRLDKSSVSRDVSAANPACEVYCISTYVNRRSLPVTTFRLYKSHRCSKDMMPDVLLLKW